MAERERVIRFDRGTILIEDFPPDEIPDGFVFDDRVRLWRAPAHRYPDVVRDLHRRKVAWRDEARAYAVLERAHRTERTPRPFQAEAVAAWRAAGRRGVVVLPTGAGKSFVAELCIADAARSALVVAPTLDLVGQWYDQLRAAFGDPVGIVGGGVHEVHPITVTTYDSAHLHMDRFGNRFGLVVFDEVHHLPGPAYAQAAELAIAPFRLGLTATLERTDGMHTSLGSIVGPVVYRREITELAGEFLSEYRTEVIPVALTDAERDAYAEARAVFRDFVDSQGLRLGSPSGWSQFLIAAGRSAEGRAAFRAWRDSQRIVRGAGEKLRILEALLRKHADNRVIIFTSDNATVHEISRRFLVPAITHQTDVKERRAWLNAFSSGEIPVVATSRVLNEGVDVPSADVGIVLSGTGTVREHVQRLGRILRRQAGKQAVLYEMVVADSAEEGTSRRRREHAAWQR